MFDCWGLSGVTDRVKAVMGLNEFTTERSACGCWILRGHENENGGQKGTPGLLPSMRSRSQLLLDQSVVRFLIPSAVSHSATVVDWFH